MDWTLFFVFLISCFAAATTGAVFPPGPWYDDLKKPSWTPPNWLFPLAWTTLYIFMSIAAARVAVQAGNAYAMAFFAVQIAVNTLWTPIFFGLQRIKTGLMIIVWLWFAVAATMIAFWQIDVLAGVLFVPYLIWVTVATALNYSVWRLNTAQS
jgi:tryptophan-rich sensory protein